MTGPLTFLQRLRFVFGDEDARNLFTVPKFANAHKHFLVIVADPNTDRIFVAHKGRFVNGRIRNPRGKATHVVRDMLKKSQFKQDFVDQFIGSLVETLKVSLPNGNHFYSFVDGAIFNIAKQMRADKKAKRAGKPPSSGIPSPIRAEEGRPSGDI